MVGWRPEQGLPALMSCCVVAPAHTHTRTHQLGASGFPPPPSSFAAAIRHSFFVVTPPPDFLRHCRVCRPVRSVIPATQCFFFLRHTLLVPFPFHSGCFDQTGLGTLCIYILCTIITSMYVRTVQPVTTMSHRKVSDHPPLVPRQSGHPLPCVHFVPLDIMVPQRPTLTIHKPLE